MSKKWRIFFKVLYYFLTFSLGVFIAIVLPNANRDAVTYEFLDNYIENGEYVKAIDLLGGLYNKNEIIKENLGENNGELIVFEMNSFLEQTIENETNEDVEEKETKRIINASYVCIIRGLERGWFESKDKNESKILINEDKKIDILQVDLDENGELDSIATLINSNYICFSIDESKFPEGANSIKLIRADGTSHFELKNLKLDFDSDFFKKTQTFIEKYNLFNEDNKFSKEEDLELESIFNQINKEDANYQKSGTYSLKEINDEAVRKSIIFVIIYFVWVYILGDCLVGKRYIFRFFKFLFKKIKNKIKPEEKNEPLALGNNFYSSVTFEITNCEELESDIIVSYEHETNKDYNFKCIITKKDNFKKKERIHGGTYKLVKVECKGYEIVDLPEKIEIKGYTMNIKFSIKKGN